MNVNYRGSGKVILEGKEYRCNLYYNDNVGSPLIQIERSGSFAYIKDFPYEVKMMFGKLDNGFEFIMYRLNRTNVVNNLSYGKTVYTYVSDYMFCGIGGEASSELLFDKVEYVLTDIVEWGGISLYRIEENGGLSINDELSDVCLIDNDKYKVYYDVFGTALPFFENQLLTDNICIEQKGRISIESKEKQVFDFYEEIFSELKGLIELSLLKRINIEEINVYSDSLYEMYGDVKCNIPIQLQGYNINKSKLLDTKPNDDLYVWLNLEKLVQSNSFEIYTNKYNLLEPIIELYLELFNPYCSAKRCFLNVVQALETYHSRFITNNFFEFRNRANNISRNVNGDNQQNTYDYLMANSHNFITLESRIADLLISNRNIYFATGDIERSRFPNSIAGTRNYYIHYDESIKDRCIVIEGESLNKCNDSLYFMLEYYILKELGFDTDNIDFIKKLRRRWRQDLPT